MIKVFRRAAGIVVLALPVLAFSPLSPSASAATTCTTGSSSGNVNTCMTSSISGTHINSIVGTATVINVERKLTVCIHSSVTGSIKCNNGGYVNVSPGNDISVSWSPNATEPAAQYCVRTWRMDTDGPTHLIGELCVST